MGTMTTDPTLTPEALARRQIARYLADAGVWCGRPDHKWPSSGVGVECRHCVGHHQYVACQVADRLAARAQAAPLTSETDDALGYADTYLAWGEQDEVAEALQALAHAVRTHAGQTGQVDLPSLLARHRLYGEEGDDQYECGCGAVSPPEAMEDDFGELLWHEAHQAEVIARAQATATCRVCGTPLSEPRTTLGLTTCSGPCNAAARRADATAATRADTPAEKT